MAQTPKTIKVGINESGKAFRVPLEIVTETTAVLGRRGSGKTNTGVVVAEGLLTAGQQVVVLDPLDVWWGMRSNQTGKGKGHDILLIGDPRKPHTDVPLEEHDGAVLADYLVDERVPAILSMRHLSKRARKRFAADFAERTYDRRGDPGKDSPCLYIVDEASTFIPQRVTGDTARLVGAFESWVRQGRASGIGVMLIDQRAASVNKDVLTQVELLVTHQLVGPQDRKAVEAWIESNDTHGQRAEFMASLASLKLGQAWFWSPAWLDCFDLIQVKLRDTFDSSKTPKPGERRVVPTGGAAFDIDQIKGQLAQTIERAKDNDPAQLKRQVRELQAENKRLTDRPAADPNAVEAAVVAAIEARDHQWHKLWDDLLHRVCVHTHELDELARDNGTPPIGNPAPVSTPARPSTRPTATPSPSPRKTRATPAGNQDDALNETQRKMLSVLVHRGQMNQPTTPRAMLAAMTGIKASGGTYGTYLSRLRTAGYIDGSRDISAASTRALRRSDR